MTNEHWALVQTLADITHNRTGEALSAALAHIDALEARVGEAETNMRARIRETEQDAKLRIEAAQAERDALAAERDALTERVGQLTAMYDAALTDMAQDIARAEQAERTAAARLEEVEKWRGAARVLCGAHVGVPQATCPVCDAAALREALVTYWRFIPPLNRLALLAPENIAAALAPTKEEA